MDAATPSLRERGIRALDEGLLDYAIELLTRAVAAAPADSESRAQLAAAYSRKGLHEQAKRSLQSAIQLQPQNAEFRYRLGAALEASGDTSGAVSAYRDTLQIDSGHADASGRLELLGIRHREPEPVPEWTYCEAPEVPPVAAREVRSAYSLPPAPTAPPAPSARPPEPIGDPIVYPSPATFPATAYAPAAPYAGPSERRTAGGRYWPWPCVVCSSAPSFLLWRG